MFNKRKCLHNIGKKMNYKDTLLYASLIQIPSISAKKEEEYWKHGIKNLKDLSESLDQQLSLFGNNDIDEIDSLISDSAQNIDKITDIFDKKTGKRDYYRIAYSIPEDVLFLDIETTGLSPIYHYVTMIGWIKNGKYDFWIVGTNPKEFINVVNKSKFIITFNGKKFDTKFIDIIFPELNIKEKPHLDLCPFCRRFGLTHGQKTIEATLGYMRPDSIHDCNGKEAVVLWYEFLFGKNDALDSLILYNFYDVCGMTYILDKIFYGYIYGKTFPKIGKPKHFYNSQYSPNIFLTDSRYKTVRKKINTNLFDINLLNGSDRKRIVGIDLAGVINKTSHTGICLLIGNTAKTTVVTYDEEIEEFVRNQKPDIISIDAPLSLPAGRTTVYDDDPMRYEAGIARYCERELWNRGVSAYPALIRSMQELTKRGIMLSHKFRELGYPVIECFPGAAQDILQLPRKRTDTNLLKTGLSRLGIHGDFETKEVIHDELDAITAAIVAKFFIAQYYEPIGIPDENDMIVPSIEKRLDDYHLVIGIAGRHGAGKTTVANYLQQHNFTYCSFPCVDEKMINNDNSNQTKLLEKTIEISQLDKRYKLNQVIESSAVNNPLIVIDGIESIGDYTYWKERCFLNFHLVYVDTDYNSFIQGESDSHNRKDQMKKQKTHSIRNYADTIIDNNGTLENLYISIDKLLSKFNL